MSRILFRIRKLVLVLVPMAVTLSCDSDAVIEPAPEAPVAQPATLQLAPLSEPVTEDDTVTMRAVLLDSDERPLPDATLTWASSDERIARIEDEGGTLATLLAIQPGSTFVTVSYGSLSASTTIKVHNRPVDILYVSGSGQEAMPGTRLPDSLVLRALDRRGAAVEGVIIEFTVTEGGGSVAPTAVVTDANGYVRSAWTLGGAGAQAARGAASAAQPRVKSLKDSVVVFRAMAASMPGTVTDLSAVSVDADAVTLAWTEVGDGAGGAASYALRYGPAGGSWADASGSQVTVEGSAVGERIAYTFAGLTPGTDYAFQLVGYRGTLHEDAVFGALSNTASATTHDPPVASLAVSPSHHTFAAVGESEQISATAYDPLGNVVAARFTYTSSDPDVVSVDTMGVMTSRAAGAASVLVATMCCDSATATVDTELTPRDSSGAAYYVSLAGSDGNAGGASAPWRRIGFALTQLHPGDTLYVRGGTYEENIQNPSIRAGRPDARIRVAAYPGERPVIRGLLWLDRPSYWTIDGVNVTWSAGNAATDHMVKMSNGVGWIYENAELWGARSFAGLLVYGSIAGEPADWTIRGNCIHDIWTDPIHHVNGDHNLYINTGTSAGAGLIERNLLFNAPNGQNVKLGFGRSDPQPGDGAAHVTVRYNTMVGALKNLMLADETHGITIERNIITDSSEDYAIRAYRLTGANNVFRDNVFGYFSRLQYGDAGYGLVTDGGGNHFPRDPMFDGVSCQQLRPADATSQGYGRWAH